MYNKEIEALVDAALTDGVLTEKEKQILYKKAESMGIDLDEFEMVLQSRLYDKQKQIEEERKKNSSAAPKSNKMGDVRKCPACGAIVGGLQFKCPECGYEFTNVRANSSISLLTEKLDNVPNYIKREDYKRNLLYSAADEWKMAVEKERVRIIESFPIPSSREDLFEFTTSLKPAVLKIKRGEECDSIDKAKANKYDECVTKIKMLFSKDEMFASLLGELAADEKKAERKKKMKNLKEVAFVIAMIVLIVLCMAGVIFLDGLK